MYTSSGIDLEYIANQPSNKTAKLEEIMITIKGLVDNGMKDSDPVFEKEVANFSKELSKMIGYEINILEGRREFFATYIVPVKQPDNSILGDMSWMMESLEKMDPVQHDVGIQTYNSNKKNMDNILKKSYDALNKTLNTKGITVDLQNAQIKGIESDFRQIIFGDIWGSFKYLNMTPREVIGVILHEVGHVFFYFNSLVKSHTNSVLVADTIKNEYLNGNKTSRETLTIVYNKLGLPKTDTDKMSMPKLAMEVVKGLIGTNITLGGNEAEYTSDVFAARFGYGADITSALKKFHDAIGENSNSGEINMFHYGAALTYTIATGVFIVVGLAGSVFTTMSVIVGLIVGAVLGIFYTISAIKTGSTKYIQHLGNYDNFIDRAKRNRQQTISRLKDSRLDNNAIRAIISQVDSLTEIIKKSGGDKTSLFQKIARKVNTTNRITATNYLVEELLNSPLVTASARLKTI